MSAFLNRLRDGDFTGLNRSVPSSFRSGLTVPNTCNATAPLAKANTLLPPYLKTSKTILKSVGYEEGPRSGRSLRSRA